MPRVNTVDWAELAQIEMKARGIVAPDREAEYQAWKHDPIKFIDDNQLVGGLLHAKQKTIIEALVEYDPKQPLIEKPRPYINDAVVSKTRQVGMSWLLMSIECWLILFWGSVRILNAHQRFDDVDDGGSRSTVKSLHGRIREMYEVRIPSWLRHRSKLSFKEGAITNEFGGFIAGSTATPNVGRGTTLDMVVLDEFAHMDWTRLIWASVSQACKRGKIANSTPNGRGNEYYVLVRDHKKRRLLKLDYHWTEHPIMSLGMHVSGDDPTCEGCVKGTHYAKPGTMTSPYYENECDIIGADDLIAQELDQSFDRSTRARVYPEADRHRHLADVQFNPAARHVVAWDFGYSGATVMILGQVELYLDRIDLEILAYHEDSGQIIDTYVPVVKAWEELYGGRPLQHVGDPAGLAKNITTGEGPIDALAKHGVFCDAPHWLHHDSKEGIRLVRVGLRGASGQAGGLPIHIRINPLADRLMDCLEQTHYPVDRNGERKPGAEMPADNEFTHGSDAFRYLVHYVVRTMLMTMTLDEDEEPRGVYLGGVLSMDF